MISALLLAAAVIIVTPAAGSNAAPAAQGRPVVPAVSRAAAACPNVLLIGARGSGEKEVKQTSGLGPEVFTLYKQMSSDLRGKLSVKKLLVVYDAASVNVLKPTRRELAALALIPLLPPPNQAAAYVAWLAAYQINHLAPYTASISQGIQSALDELTTEAAQCPKTRFVMAGYSQGAMVMHQLLWRLHIRENTALLNRIAAAALIADGDRVRGTAAIQFGTAGFNAEGIRSALLVGEHDVPIPLRTYDVCIKGDLVCNFKINTLPGFDRAAVLHESAYINAKVVKQVGDRIAAGLLHTASVATVDHLALLTNGDFSTIRPSTDSMRH